MSMLIRSPSNFRCRAPKPICPPSRSKDSIPSRCRRSHCRTRPNLNGRPPPRRRHARFDCRCHRRHRTHRRRRHLGRSACQTPAHLAGPWLIAAAAVLFLLEVFQRRTGLLANLKWDIRIAEKVKGAAAAAKPKRISKKKAKPAKTVAAEKIEPQPDAKKAPKPKTKKSEPDEKKELFDALSAARKKAQSRTRRQ